MKGVLIFGGGFLVGVALMSRVKPANQSNCCKRVAFGARSLAGPLGGAILDGLGVTPHIPGILDATGVPLDV